MYICVKKKRNRNLKILNSRLSLESAEKARRGNMKTRVRVRANLDRESLNRIQRNVEGIYASAALSSLRDAPTLLRTKPLDRRTAHAPMTRDRPLD